MGACVDAQPGPRACLMYGDRVSCLCVCIGGGLRMVAMLGMVRCVYTYGTERVGGVQGPQTRLLGCVYVYPTHSKGVTGAGSLGRPDCPRA